MDVYVGKFQISLTHVFPYTTIGKTLLKHEAQFVGSEMHGKVHKLLQPIAKFIARPYDTVWTVLFINALDLFVIDGPLSIVT